MLDHQAEMQWKGQKKPSMRGISPALLALKMEGLKH